MMATKPYCSCAKQNLLQPLKKARIYDVDRKHVLQTRQIYAVPATNGHPKLAENRPLGEEARQKAADKEFFADLLSSAATKRDARAYLNRLKPVDKPKPSLVPAKRKTAHVNLGNLFGRSRAADQSPIFTQSAIEEPGFDEEELLHVALVKIKDVQNLPENILLGIGETLSQLTRLSISPCVVVEPGEFETSDWKHEIAERADQLVSAICYVNDGGARRVDHVFTTDEHGQTRIAHRKLVTRPLRRGQIPVLTAMTYSEAGQKLEQLSITEAILALTREFAIPVKAPSNPIDQAFNTKAPSRISLDRIITIDAAGGVSNPNAPDGRDVFVNLEQEFKHIKRRLSTGSRIHDLQLENLDMLRQALNILPPTSSGLMTTYVEAANSSRVMDESGASNVGTRRQKNALIHNLLTDKPAYSSSLPAGRLARQDSLTPLASTSSFIKKGMPLTIFPDPWSEPWYPQQTRIKLTDPRIDLNRLVYLIEDSFGRKLDVEHYLNRVNDRIAGVIIAGEYEGGAILTWENPSTTEVGSAENPSILVPYLDKFAVLKRSQGAGGVADIVFNAMVRTCFPTGVCWRSRKDNPVNKWYFERSRGTWKIPDMNWTMFWTTEGLDFRRGLFSDYESVCRGVLPSWKDTKPAD